MLSIVLTKILKQQLCAGQMELFLHTRHTVKWRELNREFLTEERFHRQNFEFQFPTRGHSPPSDSSNSQKSPPATGKTSTHWKSISRVRPIHETNLILLAEKQLAAVYHPQFTDIWKKGLVWQSMSQSHPRPGRYRFSLKP